MISEKEKEELEKSFNMAVVAGVIVFCNHSWRPCNPQELPDNLKGQRLERCEKCGDYKDVE